LFGPGSLHNDPTFRQNAARLLKPHGLQTVQSPIQRWIFEIIQGFPGCPT